MKTLIIAHSKDKFDTVYYYIVDLEKESEEEILQKIENIKPIKNSKSYIEYLNITLELSKTENFSKEIEIDLKTKKILY